MTQNAQGAAISATHVLPAKPPTGPTYTGGYDSPLPRTSSPLNIRGAGQPSTLPPPPPQKYLSHNLNTNEASSSSSASRKEKLRDKKGKKRKADVLSDEEDPRLSASKSGEYMPWVNEVEWFNEDTGGPANIFKLYVFLITPRSISVGEILTSPVRLQVQPRDKSGGTMVGSDKGRA